MTILSSVYHFVLNTFLGCHHRRLTRPFTIEAQCYLVCLDCGRQRFYSTATMQPLGRRESHRLRAALALQPAMVRAPRAYPKPVAPARLAPAGPRLVRTREPELAA